MMRLSLLSSSLLVTVPQDRAKSRAGVSLVFAAGSFLVLLLSACPPGTSDDGGTERCLGQGETGIAIGATGVTFSPLTDGAVLPAWQRPQGGIGTRLNAKISGFAADTDFAAIGVSINATPPAAPVEGSLGGICRTSDAADAGVSDGGIEVLPCDRPTRCDDESNLCALEIVDISYNSFPRICQPDGSLLAPEVPIRFRNFLQLADLDGRAVALTVYVEIEGGARETQTLNVTLEESDFIEPETFNP